MKQKNIPLSEAVDQGQLLLNSVIAEQVLHALGQPDELHQVQVKHLWEDNYRVNVLVGASVTLVRVAHSFFLAADDDGNILTSSPGITKTY